MDDAGQREPGGSTGATGPAERTIPGPPAGPRDETRLTPREWVLALLLAGVQFANMVDFVIMMPLGPFMRKELRIEDGLLGSLFAGFHFTTLFGFLVASYTFTACVSAVIASKFLDRFDRRHTLLFLFGGFTVGTFLCAIAPDYLTLLLARSVAGAFGGLVGANVLTIVGDVIPPARRGLAMGVVMTAFSVAVIAGVPLGLVAAEAHGWRSPFVMLSVTCAVVLGVMWFVIPSFRGHLAGIGRGTAGSVWQVLTKPGHVPAYHLMAALVTSSFMLVPYMPTYMQENVGLDRTQLKYIYLVGGLFTLVTTSVFGRLSDLLGKTPVFYALAGLTAVPVLLVTNLPPVPVAAAIAVTTSFMVLTSGRFVPAMAMMTECAVPRERGGFMAVTTALQHLTISVATTVAGLIIGEAADHKITNYPVVGVIGAGMALLSVYLGSRLRPAARGVSEAHGAAADDVPVTVEPLEAVA